jgi:hypothetical protein
MAPLSACSSRRAQSRSVGYRSCAATTAEQVHDCLGRLLANVVVEASKMTNADKKEIR